MKQQCTVDIKKVFSYIKALISKDGKYKNFDEVAKSMIERRNDRTDDVKIVALKAIAKIYENVIATSPQSGYSFGTSGVAEMLIKEEIQTADLVALFAKIKTTYFPKSGKYSSIQFNDSFTTVVNINALTKDFLDGTREYTELELINLIKQYDSIISDLIKRVPGGRLIVVKQSLLSNIIKMRKKIEDMQQEDDLTKRTILKKVDKIKNTISQIVGYIPWSTTR